MNCVKHFKGASHLILIKPYEIGMTRVTIHTQHMKMPRLEEAKYLPKVTQWFGSRAQVPAHMVGHLQPPSVN